MRVLLLVAVCVLSGCAAVPGVAPPRDGQAALAASAAPARSTGSRTQTVGLPLGRAGKIGLWSGVALFLAYLMHTDGDDDEAASTGP